MLFKVTDKLPFLHSLLVAHYPVLEYHMNKLLDDLKHCIIGGMYLIDNEEAYHHTRSLVGIPLIPHETPISLLLYYFSKTYSRDTPVRVKRLPAVGELGLQGDKKVRHKYD